MTVTWDMIDENDYAVLRGRLLGIKINLKRKAQ